MKINRLIETTILLLNRETIKAKELAERFQVSTRTIYRDIEELSIAGVPVYMKQGKDGGISLLESYSLDKTFLSKEDREHLVIALKALQVTKLPQVDSAFEKISTLFHEDISEEWIHVDFSQWGSHPNENDKFNHIKRGILKRLIIGFEYINTLGEKTTRKVEPIKLLYKGQAWYLYGYCRLKSDFRVFRISRIKKLVLTNEAFQRQEVSNIHTLEYNDDSKNWVNLKLRFSRKVLHRLYDDFDEKDIKKKDNDTYDVSVSFPEDEWVYGYILSFGENVEVLEPLYVREKILRRVKDVLKIYTT